MKPELVEGDLDRLQLPNAAAAAHRSSHGQHPALLFLHSIWGDSVSVHLSFADAAKKTLASLPAWGNLIKISKGHVSFKRPHLKHAPTFSSIHFHAYLCLLCRLLFELDKSR